MSIEATRGLRCDTEFVGRLMTMLSELRSPGFPTIWKIQEVLRVPGRKYQSTGWVGFLPLSSLAASTHRQYRILVRKLERGQFRD